MTLLRDLYPFQEELNKELIGSSTDRDETLMLDVSIHFTHQRLLPGQSKLLELL
jgi:hypothetical protein